MYIPITKNFTIKVCGRKKSLLFLYFTILQAQKMADICLILHRLASMVNWNQSKETDGQ